MILKKYPKINESGFYHKNNQYFLSNNKGTFFIQLTDIKGIDVKSINVISKEMEGKDAKNKTCILKFRVTEKNCNIIFNLTKVDPEEYNSQITSAIMSGPYSQSTSNIEDNEREPINPK